LVFYWIFNDCDLEIQKRTAAATHTLFLLHKERNTKFIVLRSLLWLFKLAEYAENAHGFARPSGCFNVT